MCLVALRLTVCGLAKVAIFTTNVNAENQCLIKHKCDCVAMNRHFCQTAVTGWASCLSVMVLCLKLIMELVDYFDLVSLRYKLHLHNKPHHYSFELAFSWSVKFQYQD